MPYDIMTHSVKQRKRRWSRDRRNNCDKKTKNTSSWQNSSNLVYISYMCTPTELIPQILYVVSFISDNFIHKYTGRIPSILTIWEINPKSSAPSAYLITMFCS